MLYSISLVALLASLRLGSGRRVQTSILAQLQTNLSIEHSQSFAEVAAVLAPSIPAARLRDHSSLVRGGLVSREPSARSRARTLSSARTENSSEAKLNQTKLGGDVFRESQEIDASLTATLSSSVGFGAVSQALARVAINFRRRSSPADNGNRDTTGKGIHVDSSLWLCVVFWYVGHYFYNITNKAALVATGGAHGFPLTIAISQLAVGSLYGILLWVLPDARPRPSITLKDCTKFLPIGLTAAGGQACGVFALSAGAVSFAQLVKAGEPAFAALIATALYQHPLSKAKWMCLFVLIAGVVMASFGQVSFSWAALAAASLSNFFTALNKNEVEKMMYTPGLKDRMGSVPNQFALTMISAFICCIPLMLVTEGHKFGTFVQLCRETPSLFKNIVLSGLWCYMFCELATIVIKKTSAVTQSVLTSLKQAIVVVGLALVMGEDLGRLKLLGCSVAIIGSFFYAVIERR